MSTFTSQGHKSIEADSQSEAAQIFAERKARAKYGKAGVVGACRVDSTRVDGGMFEAEAFIGYRTGRNETTGSNVRFTVYLKA